MSNEIAKALKIKNDIPMEKSNKLKSFRSHLVEQFGPEGSPDKIAYKAGYEAFKLGVLMQELRKENNLTQDDLAKKCRTTKSYISRIENNGSDIRLSSFIRIFKQGFDKDLRLTLQ